MKVMERNPAEVEPACWAASFEAGRGIIASAERLGATEGDVR